MHNAFARGGDPNHVDEAGFMIVGMGNLSASLLWHFIAFSAGTGGSMLIIGSAAGVAAMGMERIDFIWYLKKISWLALIGFAAGSITFILITGGT